MTVLAQSSQPGGDGYAIVLNVMQGAVQDIGQNRNPAFFNLHVKESPDTILPILLGAQIDYNNGVMIVNASETVDATPASFVVTKRLRLANLTHGYGVNLSYAKVTAIDGISFTVRLTEKQRSLAIAISGTSGGDENAVFLEGEKGAVSDIGRNPCLDFFGIQVVETADTTEPEIKYAKLNFSTGLLEIVISETVDATPSSLIVSEKFSLLNTSEGILNVSLLGSTVKQADETSIFLKLTEQQRVDTMVFSGVRGGDDNALTLTALSGAFQDIAKNKNFCNTTSP